MYTEGFIDRVDELKEAGIPVQDAGNIAHFEYLEFLQQQGKTSLVDAEQSRFDTLRSQYASILGY